LLNGISKNIHNVTKEKKTVFNLDINNKYYLSAKSAY